VQLDNGKLEKHLIVLEDFQLIKLIKDTEAVLYVLRYLCAIGVGRLYIDLLFFKGAPESDHTRAETLDTLIKSLVELVHLYEIVTVKITQLLVLLLVHVDLMNFGDLPEQILLIDAMAALINLG
jgi:hypothetical protein